MKTAYTSIYYKGVQLDVVYDYTEYVPEIRTLSNGDPGYPAEGGDFEITCVEHNGDDIIELLSEEALRDIENKILMN